MEITRGGRVYWGPDALTAMKADGVWGGIDHKKLLPLHIKMLQDQLFDIPVEPMPSDEEMMEFAKLEHPAIKQNQEAEPLRHQIKTAWEEYKALMKTIGLELDAMPEYGGQG